MACLNLLVLIGFSLSFLHCEGKITSPPDKTKYTFLSGRTEQITWTFDVSRVIFRYWLFRNSNGSLENLAVIYRNGKTSINSNRFDIDVVKPATLVLKNVNQSYNGTYIFVLAGGDASWYINSVTVFIAKKPNITLNCSSPVTLNEGENFACLCRGEAGNPPGNVTWYKDGVKFTDVGTENQTFSLFNVSRTDRGTYTCVFSRYHHASGNYHTNEKSIYVAVYFEPTNTVIRFSKNPAVFNRPANITCTSDGFPEPIYTIYHNNTRIFCANKWHAISQVVWENAGTYKCEAANIYGRDFDSDYLNVTTEPRPTMLSMTRSRPQSKTSVTDHKVSERKRFIRNKTNWDIAWPWVMFFFGIFIGIFSGISFSMIVSYTRRKFRSRED